MTDAGGVQAAGLLAEPHDGAARDAPPLVENLRAELPTAWE